MGAPRRPFLTPALCALLFSWSGHTRPDRPVTRVQRRGAREMVASGDWITPTLNGPAFRQANLIYWLISGSYLAFGVSEFTARLPSASSHPPRPDAIRIRHADFRTDRRLRGPALTAPAELRGPGDRSMVLTDMVLCSSPPLAFSVSSSDHGEGRTKRCYWGFYIGMGLAT